MCRHVGPKFMPMAWWVPVCELLLYNLDLIGSTFRIGTPIQSSRVNGTRTRRSNNNNERTMVKGAERVEWQFLQQKAEREGSSQSRVAFFAQMLLRRMNLVHARISHSTLLPPTSEFSRHMQLYLLYSYVIFYPFCLSEYK